MENNNNGNKGTFPGVIPGSSGVSNQSKSALNTNPSITALQPNIEKPAIISTEPEVEAEGVVAKDIFNNSGDATFIKLETKNTDNQITGIIEIDLIIFRERGQESRYLSIETTGSNEEGKSNSATVNINNEKDFNQFKKFISELNWND